MNKLNVNLLHEATMNIMENVGLVFFSNEIIIRKREKERESFRGREHRYINKKMTRNWTKMIL